MRSREELSRIIIEIPKSQHKRLKAKAAIEGTSMRAIIMEALDAMDICASSSHVPNKDTREAIEELEKGKDLTEYKNFKDLLKKAGL